ncbi:unnamed protein product [Spodoptera exigua]|nr:unnamed protein product [Spodoptera exigua]CAH0697867.1 unnamed protein product [Spodoptera exigua]CAH0697869.1 unnamed protein product [Spodoptera exigua]CAH0697870.1 unnamed protein product [Spodoptera exigua]
MTGIVDEISHELQRFSMNSQSIQYSAQPGSARRGPLGEQGLRLHRLWEGLRAQGRAQGPYADTYWRASVLVRGVRREVHSALEPALPPPRHALQRHQAPLYPLSQEVQAEEVTRVPHKGDAHGRASPEVQRVPTVLRVPRALQETCPHTLRGEALRLRDLRQIVQLSRQPKHASLRAQRQETLRVRRLRGWVHEETTALRPYEYQRKPYKTCIYYIALCYLGHLAESIVVNQPRVIKVTENVRIFININTLLRGTSSHATDITDLDTKTSKFDAIFEAQTELEASIKSVKSEADVNLEDAKFYITEDKKLILQDSDKTTLNLIQEGDESTLLTIHNIGERADATILEAVNADQLSEQTEIVANDENGGMVRLIQIKLPDGNNGWVAINR